MVRYIDAGKSDNGTKLSNLCTRVCVGGGMCERFFVFLVETFVRPTKRKSTYARTGSFFEFFPNEPKIGH